jgi:hypothetical protein
MVLDLGALGGGMRRHKGYSGDEVTRTSVTFPKDRAAQLEAIAERRGSSVADVVRALVYSGLEREALVERIASAVEPEAVAV